MVQWRLAYDVFPALSRSKTKMTFNGELYTIATDPKGYRDQDVVVKNAIAVLQKDHAVFLELATGFGKTACSTYLTAHLKLKTLVLCHVSAVGHVQWPEEFRRFTNAKVQVVKGQTLDPTADVYVMGVQKAANMPKEVFADIGLVIYDEAHIATPTACAKVLLNIHPKYLIGLSASPTDRDDHMHKMLYVYFGPRKGFIQRAEVKSFTVVKYKTSYVPDIGYQVFRGKTTLDWNRVINSLSDSVERQREIGDIAIRHPEHRIMILSNRINQCTGIHEYLLSKDIDSELLIGSRNMYRKDCRVLCTSIKKAGVGFNDPTLTMLILAADCKSVKQYEGRIRTVNNLIYDIVDDFRTFETHWRLREAWYIQRGATIKYEGEDGETLHGSTDTVERESFL